MASIFDSNLQNPARVWVRFKAGKDQGFFEGYDKDQEEESERVVNLGEALNIIPLFEHYGVEGFNNESAKGFYSNEVKDITNDILSVKLGNELFATGRWSEIREKVKSAGGKFANVVYFAFFQRGKKNEILPRIGATKLSGASANVWIKANVRLPEMRLLQVKKGALIKTRTVNGKDINLSSPYYSLEIIKHKKNDDLVEQAFQFAADLKVYFEGYFDQKNQKVLIESENEAQGNSPLLESGVDQINEMHEPWQEGEMHHSGEEFDEDLPF